MASLGIHEQKENATFRGQRLAAVPSDLLTMRNLVLIDLSVNELTRFPGQLVAAEMLRLEVLHLQSNLLFVLEDILALSRAPRLRELSIQQNPLRLLDNRVYLLEALFFGAPGCDEKQLRMVHKDRGLRTHGLEQADAPGIADATPHMSKRLGHHRHLRARTRGRELHHTTMRYVSRLPRRCGFPMLQRLNDVWITDADVRAAEQERGRSVEYFLRDGAAAAAARRSDSQPGKQPSAGSGGRRRVDGSRMTAMEMLRREARSTAVPSATVIHRFQIDVESADVIEEPQDAAPGPLERPSGETPATSETPSLGAGAAGDAAAVTVDMIAAPPEQCDVIHRLFGRPRRFSSALSPSRQARASLNSSSVGARTEPAEDDGSSPNNNDGESEDEESADADMDVWSFPIATFDRLSSEDRQYVRQRSKQTATSILRRDDEFFASSVFLDCVVQAERSRRLTQHAVDALCPRSEQGAPSSSQAAARLRATMETTFSRDADEQGFAKLRAFQQSLVSAEDKAKVLGDVLARDHAEQRQRTTRLLQSSHSEDVLGTSAARMTSPENDLAAVARTLDDSLSRTKLRNAVDLANVLSDKKQEKRVLQLLLDADAKVIEEERVALEQALHRHRLELIATNKFYGRGSTLDADRDWMRRAQRQSKTTPSPWQERNWRAKEVAAQPSRSARRRPATAATHNRLQIAPRFRTIETVDKAARDSLAHVNSHDLLVRCAEIRQHAASHVAGLAAYRDQFLEHEAEWEAMRQDPINVVRRHLRRQLHEGAEEIQIGSTQLFYSSLFQ
ncbi:hypothetical protein ATCC90586_005249 [Pythium insidiosum]|nr:hypothetical protein ATCC90586_005249 [Pythium insidiosum]